MICVTVTYRVNWQSFKVVIGLSENIQRLIRLRKLKGLLKVTLSCDMLVESYSHQ